MAIDPNDKEILVNFGCLYCLKGDYDEAITYTQKAIAVDANYPLPWNVLGYVYSDLENYNKAVESCQKAIELAPKNATYFSNMADTYRDMKNYDKAVERDWFELTHWLEMAEALQAYDKAVELAPDNESIRKDRDELAAQLNKSQRMSSGHKKFSPAPAGFFLPVWKISGMCYNQ